MAVAAARPTRSWSWAIRSSAARGLSSRKAAPPSATPIGTSSIATATKVNLEVFSEALCFAAILREGDCNNLLMVTQSSAETGECPSSGQVCLAPGFYQVFVAPDAFSGVPFPPTASSPSNQYVLRISGEPCDASPPANDTCGEPRR